MAKRNCRRTLNETKIHEKAVKMRKMTDEQLVYYVEDRVEKAKKEGYNKGLEAGRKEPKVEKEEKTVKAFLHEIQSVKGVGAKLVDRLTEYADAYGYLESGKTRGEEEK